jgi:hypothetical protein
MVQVPQERPGTVACTSDMAFQLPLTMGIVLASPWQAMVKKVWLTGLCREWSQAVAASRYSFDSTQMSFCEH